MRRLLVLAVLVPSFAHAAGDETTGTYVLTAAAGGALLIYGGVQTGFMLDQLFRYGYSEPEHTAGAGCLAAASLVASIAGLVNVSRANDERGVAGFAALATFSLAMGFVVLIAAHGWNIRHAVAE